MTYAIIETGGKQYRVKEGDEIYIELKSQDGDKLKFDKVMAILKDDKPTVGTPYVKGATVEASFLKTGKAKKIIVYKMRPKTGYRRKQGHRQPYTKVRIDKIILKAGKNGGSE